MLVQLTEKILHQWINSSVNLIQTLIKFKAKILILKTMCNSNNKLKINKIYKFLRTWEEEVVIVINVAIYLSFRKNIRI